MRIAIAVLLAALAFAADAFAQSASTVFAQNPKTQSDELLRIEIAHLREIISVMESKNEARFVAQERAVAVALANRELAAARMDAATEKRFEAMNEFRNQLKDQAGTFITRGELLGWMIAAISIGFATVNVFRRRKDEKPL